MNRISGYLAALILPTVLLVAGCAQQAIKPGSTNTPPPDMEQATQPESPASGQAPPDRTGIPACDDYLDNYKACHRAAGIYSPNTIDKHYQVMHDTLMTESRNPSSRSALAARCVALASLLKKALHGKSCTPPASASASSSP